MNDKISDNSKAKVQTLNLMSRKSLSIDGVDDIESFSDKEVILSTNLGRLLIRGEGLKLSKLVVETGDFNVSGLINSMTYQKSSQNKNTSFFERIFK